MSTAYQAQPHSPLDPPKKKPNRAARILLWAVLGILVFFLLAAAILTALFSYTNKEDFRLATEACEEKVLDWAKYPGGASFVEPIEVTTDQDRMEAGRLFKAHGEVDFPNGFGTPVRGAYKCSVYLRDGLVENAEASVFGMKQ